MAISAAVVRSSFLHRAVGAAALRPSVFEEVEADRGATAQACAVVLLSSVAAGVGARGFGSAGLAAVGFFSVVALLSWVAWSLVTFEIGVRLLPDDRTRADLGELMRTTGFAAAPGVLRVLGVIPVLAVPALVISSVWMLAAMVVAVRQALDYRTTGRALAVCLLGWTFAVGFAVLFGVFFGPRLS